MPSPYITCPSACLEVARLSKTVSASAYFLSLMSWMARARSAWKLSGFCASARGAAEIKSASRASATAARLVAVDLCLGMREVLLKRDWRPESLRLGTTPEVYWRRLWLSTGRLLLVLVNKVGGHLVGNALPAVGGVAEVLGGGGGEGTAFGPPGEALDVDEGVLDADDVEGVRLAAVADGGGRARRDDERAVARDLVARRAVARVADVQVAREQHVRAAVGYRLHRQLRAAHQLVLVVPLRHVEGVVRDDDLGHVIPEGAELVADGG